MVVKLLCSKVTPTLLFVFRYYVVCFTSLMKFISVLGKLQLQGNFPQYLMYNMFRELYFQKINFGRENSMLWLYFNLRVWTCPILSWTNGYLFQVFSILTLVTSQTIFVYLGLQIEINLKTKRESIITLWKIKLYSIGTMLVILEEVWKI